MKNIQIPLSFEKYSKTLSDIVKTKQALNEFYAKLPPSFSEAMWTSPLADMSYAYQDAFLDCLGPLKEDTSYFLYEVLNSPINKRVGEIILNNVSYDVRTLAGFLNYVSKVHFNSSHSDH